LQDHWIPDPLIPRSFQPRDEHFRGMGFDRGHIARSRAVAWGDMRSAGIARRQAFFWTNTSPQRSAMNRHRWLAAELWEAKVVEERGRAVGYSLGKVAARSPRGLPPRQGIGRSGNSTWAGAEDTAADLS
jgi:DNA/RNA endonuclease G (NUC1)